MINKLLSDRRQAAVSPPAATPAVPYAIPGRCLFEDGEEQACSAYGSDSRSIEIACRKVAAPGMEIVAYLDNIGLVRGRAGRSTPRGFILAIEMNEARRARVAVGFEWHAARAAETADQRAAPRIVPIHREVEIRLGEDLAFPGTIVDLSMSGAAIAAPARFRPYVGSVVKVGRRQATVVRLTEAGFAVQFKLAFIRENFNENVVV